MTLLLRLGNWGRPGIISFARRPQLLPSAANRKKSQGGKSILLWLAQVTQEERKNKRKLEVRDKMGKLIYLTMQEALVEHTFTLAPLNWHHSLIIWWFLRKQRKKEEIASLSPILLRTRHNLLTPKKKVRRQKESFGATLNWNRKLPAYRHQSSWHLIQH